MSEQNQNFKNYNEWQNNASTWLGRRGYISVELTPHLVDERALCFDQYGRICRNDADFIRARDEKTFPVEWVWPRQLEDVIATWLTCSGG